MEILEFVKVFGRLADINTDDNQPCQTTKQIGKADVMLTQFDFLISVLDEEAECYQRLLACIQAEKRAIVDMDFDQLAELGGQKECMLLQLRQLSARRSQSLQKLTLDMALPLQDITLDQLSQQAPIPYGGELQRCRSQLRKVLALLGSETDNVKQLVNHGLALVRGSYQMITQLLDANPVYHSSGNMQPAAATGRFHNSDY